MWAYKVIPKIHDEGIAMVDNPVIAYITHILGWTSTNHPSFKDLCDSIFREKKEGKYKTKNTMVLIKVLINYVLGFPMYYATNIECALCSLRQYNGF